MTDQDIAAHRQIDQGNPFGRLALPLSFERPSDGSNGTSTGRIASVWLETFETPLHKLVAFRIADRGYARAELEQQPALEDLACWACCWSTEQVRGVVEALERDGVFE